jgi:hypothetical protein
MTDIQIHNLLYEHRKNVCRLMVTETMTQLQRNKLNAYIEQLQQRLNLMSKRMTIKVEFVEPEEVKENLDMTVGDYIEMMDSL